MVRFGIALGGLALGMTLGCVDGDELSGGLRGEGGSVAGGAQGEGGQGGGGGEGVGGEGGGGEGGGPGATDARPPTGDARVPDDAGLPDAGGSGCAAETCNGTDDDCDGLIDEGAGEVCGPAEAGVGRCVAGERRCLAGFLQECVGAISAADEFCDTVDNDCDGAVDEGLDCAPCAADETQVCFSGEPAQAAIGICRPGTQTCDAARLVFGPCAGEVAPGGEICNGADDDCDGTADEALFDPDATCMVGVGACAAPGAVVCTLDGLGCEGAAGPDGNEICNGLDDDCDGRTDEAFELGEACAEGVGVCAVNGALVCGPDGGLVCEGVGGAAVIEDPCNGLDDDCDGQVDEAVACYRGLDGTQNVGACRAGTEVCGEGCVGAILPGDEQCNGADDDCDGNADEGIGCECDAGERSDCFEGAGLAGVGICQNGARTCLDDSTWGPCEGVVNAQVEACNAIDDDCDRRVDENLTNRCGDCGPEPDEVCNSADDDCDGRTDEGTTNSCGECGPVPREVCNGGDDDCDGRTDEGVVNACGECGVLAGESCDGRDDDCDGRIDEGTQNACGGCGAVPREVCNGNDDDCDGGIDEGLLNVCGRCGAVPNEACNGNDDDCDGSVDEGVLNACGGCGAVPNEVCNGRDDDCDGQTDERVQNLCGGCGAVPDEVCNGGDDDCDGRTDEGVSNVCGGCGAVPAEICDGIDNDCDNSLDE
ncbi:MAG: Notch-like protein, partial [Bradymonadia bacterium]